jgi:epoxide hydrolase-like predicted phosphatase
MIKAILFDCFGVLYPDTYWTMAHEFLGEDIGQHEQDLHDLVRAVDLGHITREELWNQFAQLVGVRSETIYARLEQFGGLDKRLLEFIENRKTSYKFGMISNVGRGFLERMFTDKPAEYYFDTIVLSSDVHLVKPDRRIYELAAERLHVTIDECVFIDDIEQNVQGAVVAGMQGIHYRSYDRFIKDIQELLG